MLIALLTHEPFYPPSGGGSAAAVYLVRELVERGHSVEVFGPSLAKGREIEERFSIRLRPFTAWTMGRTTALRTAKYLAYPWALAQLVNRAVIAGSRYEVLVSQHAIAAVAAGRLQRRWNIPAVFNLLDCLTGFMETWPAYLMPRPFARTLVRYELSLPRRYRASRVLTVSDALKERVVANGYPEDRVRSIYYGYDDALFQCPAGAALESASPLIVMHGSFDHHHLGPIAREAILHIYRHRRDARFRFIGPHTVAFQAFMRSIRDAVPSTAIEAPGFVPYEQVPSLVRGATLGITPYQPSTGTHCAFVAKTVEYLALGIPVVCTPLESALRYYAGLDGVKFSGADGLSFAQRVLEWLAQPASVRRAAVEPARLKVQSELPWAVVCRRAAEFIEGSTASPSNR